jgi:hypothetical protein
MTTIAWRDGVLAADSGMTDGGVVLVNKYPKIAQNRSGDMTGACGASGFCDKFLDWFNDGEKGDQPHPENDGDAAIIVRSDDPKRLELYEKTGKSYLEVEYYALGSGFKMAMGAMWMGASAEEAVKCGVALDAYTRGPIMVMKHVHTD